MKEVKAFFDTNDEAINKWLNKMYASTEKTPGDSIEFIVHDIKISSYSRGGVVGFNALVIYEFN